MLEQEQIKNLYKMIRYFKKIGSPRDTARREAVRAIRRIISNNIIVDPWGDRANKSKYICGNLNDCLAITVGTMWNSDTRIIHPNTIWIDDYKKWLGQPFKNLLHLKTRYIRVGDEFYDKDSYIEYEGKAYSKEDYVLYKYKPMEKKNVCLIQYYEWDEYNCTREKKEIVLLADENEELWTGHDNDEAVIGIEINPPYNTQGRLRCVEFIKSMFRVGTKRLKPENGRNIYLSREDLNNFNFMPSESHKLEMGRYVEEAVTTADILRFGNEEINTNIHDVGFRLFLCNHDYSGTSLKQKLINLIVRKCNRRRYTGGFRGIKELFIRLRAFKEMLETEAEYAR